MTLEPTEASESLHTLHRIGISLPHSSHHGPFPRDPSGVLQASAGRADGASGSGTVRSRSRDSAPRSPCRGVDADVLDERLRGLRIRGRLDAQHHAGAAIPGQRIFEYENALALQTPKQAIICDLPNGRAQLDDLPNEILTHVFSHLPPDSHSSVALVSRRFSALISTHHAWRMAFMRHFPGHTAMAACTMPGPGVEPQQEFPSHTSALSHMLSQPLRSDTRYFSRLTPNATWRSEYLLRTRYLRSLARGKPGSPQGAGLLGGPRSGKKPAAVLTFNSKLPWRVTSLDVAFSNGSKPPRVIQGSGDFGIATVGDPTTGKIEKWGIEDLYSSAQLEDAMSGLVPYGLGQGPAAVPNIMAVSQYYGMLAGEGFPGGRAYLRGVTEPRGRYLNAESAVADKHPDIPRVPRGLEAICSVWLARSPAVVSATHHMCGLLTGSSLGIITAYSLHNGTAGSRQTSGEVSARWAVSPGVPIIALKVDESYCQTRKAAKRVWAVALNALGEVYYLTEVPCGKLVRTSSHQDAMCNAWHAGRTACWHLLHETRRVVKPAELDDDDFLQDYASREPAHQQGLDPEQLVAETREVDRFLMVSPARVRQVFHGWDMQRKLEVDFAGDDGKGAGENIFVADCGLAEGLPACIRRYTRSLAPQPKQSEIPIPLTAPSTPSLFGAIADADAPTPRVVVVEPQTPRSPPPTPRSPAALGASHDWACQVLALTSRFDSVVSAIALDGSSPSLLNLHEEATRVSGANEAGPRGPAPWSQATDRETPGRRARLIVAGTTDGVVLVWNAREEVGEGALQPIRVISTDSPKITCVAASALYVVHGGSDGLVQAWDPLCSTTEPVRTICAKANGRAPRHMMIANQRFREADLSAVGTIYLDPDPTILQGIVSFGTSLRSWSYSSAGRLSRHKSSHHHHHHRSGGAGDPDSRLASRRQAGLFLGHIAAEEAELRREQEQRAREHSRLSKRFGALGDLTEEEALVYAQMLSQEEFQQAQELRRAGDVDSNLDVNLANSDAAGPADDTASSWYSETGSEATWTTPDASIAGPSNTADAHVHAQTGQMDRGVGGDGDGDGDGDVEVDFEQQLQQAIRLSLMESSNDEPAQPEAPFPPEAAAAAGEHTIKYDHGQRQGKAQAESWTKHHDHAATGSSINHDHDYDYEDEDLMLALSLSMQDQRQSSHEEDEGSSTGMGLGVPGDQQGEDEFPSLPQGKGMGKGKGVQR